MSDDNVEDAAFETFAQLYPHEAYALDHDKFFAYFQKTAPGIDRLDMIKLLNETEKPGSEP